MKAKSLLRLLACLVVPAHLALASLSASAGVLDDVKQRGALRCGVGDDLTGFSVQDDGGAWSGFDVDYCHAIAAAVLGDPAKVEFVPLTLKDRFRALQAAKVDVLFRKTAWTMSRDTALGIKFPAATFYDGQGFMVPRSLGIDSALQLTGAKVCLEPGSEAEAVATAYFKRQNMAFTGVPVKDAAEQVQAYIGAKCNTATGLLTDLYAVRATLDNADDNLVLPNLISKEPLGPVVLQSDDKWFAVVRWVHFALVDAEELGVTQANVAEMKTSGGADIRLLLGADGGLGKDAGLHDDWALRAIAAIGNYGEVFERNLGANSALKIPRGMNALWTAGGLQYAPPIH